MILTCPECATRYQTDASHFLPDGRKVRCAKCSHVWFQAAPIAEAEAPLVEEETAAPEPAPAPQRSAAVAQAAPAQEAVWEEYGPGLFERFGLGLGWAGLALIVLAIGWSFQHYRQDIARLWPQSASLYKAVGMSVNTRGIEIESSDRQAHIETEDGQDVLVITGNLVNVTSRELSVPPVRVTLVDDAKRELYHWSFVPSVSTLHAGQSAPFRTRLPNPPPAMKHIQLRFAERSN